MPEPNEKRAYSPSKLKTYSRCAEQYRRRYVMGDKILPTIVMVAGTGIHRGAEFNETQKIKSHGDLPAADIVGYSVEAFKAEVAGGGVIEEAQHSGTVLKGMKDDGIDRTAKLAALYAHEVAPRYQPVAVEVPITIDTGEIKLEMVIDTVTDGDQIRDRKSMGASPPAGFAHNDWQLSANAAGFYATYGRMPSAVILDALVDLKRPKYVESSSTREISDIQAVHDRLVEFDRAITAGVFVPTADTKMVCQPHLCGYYQTCGYVQKTR